MNLDLLPDIVTPIRSWAARDPDAAAITHLGTTTSRQALDRSSDAIAAALRRRGIGIGDRVGIMGTASPLWCFTALAVLKLGATVVPMPERLSGSEVAAILGRVGAKAIVSDAGHARLVKGAAEADPSHSWWTIGFDELSESPDPSEPIVSEARGDRLAIIAFTSGSTGLPKGSMLTHAAVMHALFEWVLLEPALLRCRALDVTSLAYLGGLLNSYLAPMIFGGSIVMLPKWDPAEALRLVEEHGITSMAGTTIFYEQMAAAPAFASADLRSVTVAIAGGSPVHVPLLRAWQARGVSIRQGYGLTEGASVVTLPPPEVASAHPDVAGVGGILREVRIFDEHDEPCPAGTPGQIVVRGPGLSCGYWEDPATTAEEFRGGWLHTGDVGTIDATGALRVVGRTKDVIISGGINIYAAELERVIAELPGVVEAAVIGVPDAKFGETPAAIVVADGTITAADVTAHCRARLAGYKTPRYVELTDEALPRTPLGKLMKEPLRARYGDLPTRSPRGARTGP